MTMQFTKATKKRAKARVAIDGPSGAGKTYTALIAATVLADGGRVAVIDTERGSASLYSDEFNFDVIELNEFHPQHYIDAIEAAEAAGYAVLVIDSLSHAWEGEGGALDLVDRAAKRSQAGNSYTAWKDVTPLHRRMVDAMLQSQLHIVATMRSKMDYVQEKDERTNKTVIRKVGMAPIQRQGTEYEFTLVCDIDIDHNLVVTKSRCKPLADKVEQKPGAKFFKTFLDWLNSGADPGALAPKPAESSPVKRAADEVVKEIEKATEQVLGQQPPPQAGANGNGKTAGKATGAAAPKRINRDALGKRWAQLWQTAKALGITVEGVDGDITTEAWVARGQQLSAAILKRANLIVNTHPDGKVILDDSDEQIVTQALRLAPTWEEQSHAKAA